MIEQDIPRTVPPVLPLTTTDKANLVFVGKIILAVVGLASLIFSRGLSRVSIDGDDMIQRKMWAIVDQRTGDFFGLSVSSNDPNAEFCNPYSACLVATRDAPWLTNRREIADTIIREGVEWYNSSIENPELATAYRKHARVVEMTLSTKEEKS